jgi:membrane-associated phospholipid phosphatase
MSDGATAGRAAGPRRRRAGRLALAALCAAAALAVPALAAQETAVPAVERLLPVRVEVPTAAAGPRLPLLLLAPAEAATPDLAPPERRLLPPGLLRYRIPEAARPLAIPYAAVGATLLVADPYMLRTLKLDSLFIREDGTETDHRAYGVFRAFSHLGDLEVLAGLLAGLYVLGGSRERDAARVGGVAYGNALMLTAAGKYLIGKERPYVSGGRLRYHGPNRRHTSFPSAHSSGTASVAHVLAHYYPDGRVLWYGLSGMAGISRIALARHWPSDVWWGWGVGITAAEGALGERERIERWQPW